MKNNTPTSQVRYGRFSGGDGHQRGGRVQYAQGRGEGHGPERRRLHREYVEVSNLLVASHSFCTLFASGPKLVFIYFRQGSVDT